MASNIIRKYCECLFQITTASELYVQSRKRWNIRFLNGGVQ